MSETVTKKAARDRLGVTLSQLVIAGKDGALLRGRYQIQMNGDDTVDVIDTKQDAPQEPADERLGVHESLSFENYLALDAMSSSGIRRTMESVDSWRHYNEHGIGDTKSLRLGRLFHCLVLEPERFQREHVDLAPPVDVGAMNWRHAKAARHLVLETDLAEVASDCNCGVTKAKSYLKESDVQALADFYREHGTDFEPTSESEIEQVQRMRDALHAHPKVRGGLLEGGRAEVSMVWQLDGYGRLAKCRPDYLVDIGGAWLVVDLKGTSKSADADSFQRTMMRFRYDVQAAWYADGIEQVTGKPVEHFLFVACEFNEPHGVGIHDCDAAVLDCGRHGTERHDGYIDGLDRLAAADADPSAYTGYSPDIQTLTLPAWA